MGSIVARQVFYILISVLVMLLFVHICLQWYRFTFMPPELMVNFFERFNMDQEISVPSWFNQLLLLTAGCLFAVIAWYKKHTTATFIIGWVSLAIIFFYLSMDEGAALHETLSAPVGMSLGIQKGYLFFAWVVPVALLISVFVIAFWRFWQHLPLFYKRLFAGAFVLYVSGAMGVESLGANYASHIGQLNLTYSLLVALEEGLENLSIIILIYGLLHYIATFFGKSPLRLHFKSE